MSFDLTNINNVYLLLGVLLAVLGLVLAIYGLINWLKHGRKIATRIDTFVADEYRGVTDPKASPIVPREISGSLFTRTIGNWVNNFIEYLGRFAPQTMLADLDHQLTVAGNPGKMTATGFFTLRLLFLLAGVVLAYLLNRDLSNVDLTSVALGALLIIVAWLLPSYWLRGKMRNRQEEILHGLPDALDMLSVCASAGLGFDQSLQRISSYWETELGEELRRVTREMEMGIPRSEALRNMSDRLDVDDLTRFIATIIQAEKIGMSYATVLHSQAKQMRILRQLRAREIANRLPGKMILPVALFIFPAMLAVILGPAIPALLSIF